MEKNKKLTSLDDMFGGDIISVDPTDRFPREMDINLLMPFHDHKFKLYTGERRKAMKGSIQEFGILEPILIRPYQQGYEILAGHNRWNIGMELGFKKVPIDIKNVDDDEAQLIVTETNINQQSFHDRTISEKAYIISSHYEILKKTGKRKELVKEIESDEDGQIVHELKRDTLGEEFGLTGRDISRYIRINMLLDGLKEMVDQKDIPFGAGVTISYLTTENQKVVSDEMQNGGKMDLKKASQLRSLEDEGKLNEISIAAILAGVLDRDKNSSILKKGIKLKPTFIKKYFKEGTEQEEAEAVIDKALEEYFKSRKN